MGHRVVLHGDDQSGGGLLRLEGGGDQGRVGQHDLPRIEVEPGQFGGLVVIDEHHGAMQRHAADIMALAIDQLQLVGA